MVLVQMAAAPSLFLQSVRVPQGWDDVGETTSSITRARIFDSMARAVSERGYAAVTVSDVVTGARISRRTFYEQFEDKEHCFLETYRTGCENGIAQIDTSLRELENPDWRTRLSVSLETYLRILAAEPHFARVLLIDVLGAGSAALEARERVLGDYVEHYRGLGERARAEEPDLPAVPDAFVRGLVGGIAELVQHCLLESPATEVSDRLRALHPTLLSFAASVLTGGRENRSRAG
ncbi:MAG TPA: TetR/AcrR family transcriptional regulator [Solirubrobacteraceae bacterium]|nr:TetR/AcrR family transcriptional regulator [Solirubrobacteraceae bacterium]